MAGIIRARARYVKETGKFENNTFHNIKIKQEEWKVAVKLESDKTGASLTTYETLKEFLDHWDICAKINP